jgi:hypothetical protein
MCQQKSGKCCSMQQQRAWCGWMPVMPLSACAHPTTESSTCSRKCASCSRACKQTRGEFPPRCSQPWIGLSLCSMCVCVPSSALNHILAIHSLHSPQQVATAVGVWCGHLCSCSRSLLVKCTPAITATGISCILSIYLIQQQLVTNLVRCLTAHKHTQQHFPAHSRNNPPSSAALASTHTQMHTQRHAPASQS